MWKMSELKRDFFISYNKADAQWAEWIAATLKQAGYTCYIQAWDFHPGDNFVLDMHKSLINTERFIAVLSSNYLTSLYCQTEWAAAFTKDPNNEKRLFIPVRVSDCTPEGLLAAIVYIDLFGVDNEEAAKKQLLNGIDVKNVPSNRPSYPGTSKTRFPGSLPFNNLPFSRNKYFIGRDKVFKNICTIFERGEAISLTQTITGMGGLGKTQTALEYAYRYAHKYEYIWWVKAETKETILIDYKEFAVKTGQIGEEQQDSKLIIETVLNWMDSHSKWLFIYDNVDIVSDDTDWWPRNNRENILITTRNNHMTIGKKVDIDVFTKKEANDFLIKRTGIDNDSPNACKLSDRLGHLPLALEQAAAYIKINKNTSYDEYLSLLKDYGLEVLNEVDGLIDYTQPLAATLELSINKINQEEARQLLYLCAYMAPEDIYEALFNENTELLPTPLRTMLSNRLTGNRIWKQLTRYSLLEKQENGKSYSMHRLLQEIIQNKIKHEPQWLQCCLSLFNKTYHFTYGDVAIQNQFLKLTPHVEAFLDVATTILVNDNEKKEIAHLYHMGGFGNHHLGKYQKALEWYQKALAICERVLGKEHPDTATTYNNIANVYKNQDNYEKAIELYEKALAICEKVLGKEHPNTVTISNNLASIYNDQGD